MKEREEIIKDLTKNMLEVGDTGYYIVKLPTGEHELTKGLVTGVRVTKNRGKWTAHYEVDAQIGKVYSGEKLFRTPELAFRNEIRQINKAYGQYFSSKEWSKGPDKVIVLDKSEKEPKHRPKDKDFEEQLLDIQRELSNSIYFEKLIEADRELEDRGFIDFSFLRGNREK